MKNKPLTSAQKQARHVAKQQAAAIRDGYRDRVLPSGKTLSARSQALADWVKGKKFLVDTDSFIETVNDLDGLESCCFCEENHTRHDPDCPVFLLTKIIPNRKVSRC